MKKAKGTVFVEHIKEHITKGDKGLHNTDVVICKICEKSVEEIYEEWKKKEGSGDQKQ